MLLSVGGWFDEVKNNFDGRLQLTMCGLRVIYSAIDGVLVIILPADDILQKVPFLEF
jgi:hypothetical protein